MNEETFGKLLKQARHALALSQQGLAQKLGVRASHIGYLEQGRRRPSLSLLNALADTLGLDKGRLFVLSYPEAQNLISSFASKQRGGKKRTAWQQLLADKALLARNQVTSNELKVLSHITLLGCVYEPRDYLFILNSIRQAVKQ
jgi:transcriptional regulator with XRE-family HTH domain